MSNNQKEKLLSSNLIQKFLEDDHKLPLEKNEKFTEIVSSLTYYLKSFLNIKRFLDYIALILKHTLNQHLILQEEDMSLRNLLLLNSMIMI